MVMSQCVLQNQPKQTPERSYTHRLYVQEMLDNLRFASFDLLIAIALYLHPFDARKIAASSVSLRDVFTSEYLWSQYLQMQVKGFRNLQTSDIHVLQTLIGVHSQFEMFCRFRHLSSPLLGYYRLADNFGTLYRILIADHSVVCRLINADDEEDDELAGFELTLCNAQMRRLSLSPNEMHIHSDSLLFTFEGRPALKLIPLPPLCSSDPDDLLPDEILTRLGAVTELRCIPQLSNLLGLVTAHYGPHGPEILHLSIESPCSQERSVFGEPVELCQRWRLRGLKVTGDPNVPNGNLTFTVDLTEMVSISDAVERDRRPLIFSNSIGTNRVEHIHMAVHRVAAWYRGHGQINSVPGEWDPDWVPCSVLVYNEPRELSGAVGILLWDDFDSFFRHSMELFPMVESNFHRRIVPLYSCN